MTDATDGHAADNGGKYEGGVKKRWLIVPNYLQDIPPPCVSNKIGVTCCLKQTFARKVSNVAFSKSVIRHSRILCFVISFRKLMNSIYTNV